MALKMSFEQGFETYVRSGFPIIVVPTTEVDRATQAILRLKDKCNKELGKRTLPPDKEYLKTNGYTAMIWDCINGWQTPDRSKMYKESIKVPQAGLKWLISHDEARPGFYVMQNAHMFFADQYTLPELVQFFREQFNVGRRDNKHLFLVGNAAELPSELQSLAVYLEFNLPTREEIYEFMDQYLIDLGLRENIPDEKVRIAADAGAGLTLHEIESALCVAIISSKGQDLDREIIFEEKSKMVKKSGLLEHIPTDTNLGQIGGLVNIKSWLGKVASPFTRPEKAREYGLPTPKGCLIAGVSGTGKTAAAKATAQLFGVPLFRLDIGRLFGGLVGSTEQKTRDTLKLMEAMAPCVVLVDEIEKALSGTGSSNESDAGVTSRMFGNILTWMQEKTAPVYIIATANDVGKLPPEMLRKGRFDELWFVDLPNAAERLEILCIHIKKVGRDPLKYKKLTLIASDEHTKGFTGAELEAIIKQAMFNAFFEDRQFKSEDILAAAENTIPLVHTMPKEVAELRKWANGKARAASTGEKVNIIDVTSKKMRAGSVFLDSPTKPSKSRTDD